MNEAQLNSQEFLGPEGQIETPQTMEEEDRTNPLIKKFHKDEKYSMILHDNTNINDVSIMSVFDAESNNPMLQLPLDHHHWIFLNSIKSLFDSQGNDVLNGSLPDAAEEDRVPTRERLQND